jgi:general secretion pathway protein J
MKRAGFALLELLVAIAIFTVVAAMAYGGLNTIARSREIIQRSGDRLKAVQLSVNLLERDLRRAASRPLRGTVGETVPAFVGSSTALELTHVGFASSTTEARSALERAGYRIDRDRLQRLSYAVVDRAPGSVPLRRDLLDNVTRLRLRYLDSGAQWRDEWPPRDGADAGIESLPRAVEFLLQTTDYGDITRLVEIPQGGAHAPASPGAAP